ncbi:MAG: ADP-ribosylglycohydrolase family protein [Candidatus Tectomicrobia bacterium]|nr:ADP-ribosylglycohydrolase family protein [Candidatus Tectomicrobia bacterium]
MMAYRYSVGWNVMLTLSKFLSQLSEWTRPSDGILADALEQMLEWVQLPPDKAVSQISKVGLTPNYSEGWQGISPFVTGSVLWCLYSFLRAPDDYWESICIAIAVSGDVDTTAAMTGAIGLEGIPSSLAKQLNDRGMRALQEVSRKIKGL